MIAATSLRLPDFLIVGAMRGGTNSLGHYLAEHPQVSIARSELHFFDRDEQWKRGAGHYTTFFDSPANADRVHTWGERTPAYSDSTRPGIDPPIPERIVAMLPDVKFLWCLRDPVERAWSHHWHRVDRGRTLEDFETVLERQQVSGERRFPLYLERGLYASQVRAFLGRVPRERMHFVLSEDLFAQPRDTLRGIYSFLRVDADWQGDRVRDVRNSSKQVARIAWLDRLIARPRGRTRLGRRLQRMNKRLASRPRPAMVHETRARLTAFFAPHNADLAGLTGLDLSAWS